MKPETSKSLIRDRTAYRSGRLVASVFLALNLAVVAVAIVSASTVIGARLNEAASGTVQVVMWIYVSLCIAEAFVAILLWSLAQAVFDIADSALAGVNSDNLM